MLSDCQNLNRLTGNRGRLHSAHWLASRLKLAARCPVSGCWPSCYYCNLSTFDQNVTTTAIGLQSTLNRLVGCFPAMMSSLAKSKQIIGCALSDAFFLKFSYFLMFFKIQIDLIILKTERRAIYFNNRKHHCISPLNSVLNVISICVVAT